MCVCGDNHVAFYGNMAVVVLVFAELRWRRWLCAKKPRRGTAMDKKNGRLPTREGARRRRREGGRDACAGGRGAHFGVVRHLKVPI